MIGHSKAGTVVTLFAGMDDLELPGGVPDLVILCGRFNMKEGLRERLGDAYDAAVTNGSGIVTPNVGTPYTVTRADILEREGLDSAAACARARSRRAPSSTAPPTRSFRTRTPSSTSARPASAGTRRAHRGRRPPLQQAPGGARRRRRGLRLRLTRRALHRGCYCDTPCDECVHVHTGHKPFNINLKFVLTAVGRDWRPSRELRGETAGSRRQSRALGSPSRLGGTSEGAGIAGVSQAAGVGRSFAAHLSALGPSEGRAKPCHISTQY